MNYFLTMLSALIALVENLFYVICSDGGGLLTWGRSGVRGVIKTKHLRSLVWRFVWGFEWVEILGLRLERLGFKTLQSKLLQPVRIYMGTILDKESFHGICLTISLYVSYISDNSIIVKYRVVVYSIPWLYILKNDQKLSCSW